MDEHPSEVEKVTEQDGGQASGSVENEKGMAAAAEQELEGQSRQKGILKEPKTYEDAIPHSVEPQELEKEGGKR